MQRLVLTLVALTVPLATACADAPIDLLISAHAVQEGSLDDETGEITGCEAPTQIGEGLLLQDLFINLSDPATQALGFQVGVIMENQLTDSSRYAPIGEGPNQRINQNHIEVQGYELVFEGDDSGFNTLGSSGDVRFEATGIVPTDGVLYAGVTLFYPNELADWADAHSIASRGETGAIVPTFAKFQVVGRTVGGSNVESNQLTIPIQICDDCSRPSSPICVATE